MAEESTTIKLSRELVSRVSLTPEDAGCQELLKQRLEKIGFKTQTLQFADVTNLWAKLTNSTHESEPLFVFAGHTDVVPAGGELAWNSKPFHPEIRDGCLYGRGAADMKGSLAAFVTACERFIANNPNHIGSIGLLITSDEEGDAINGTKKVMQWLDEQGEKIKWCLVGEPTAEEYVGDVVKNGRRGSLNGKLKILGQQGHVAYPHLLKNPLHLMLPFLNEFVEVEWDKGNEFFPATTLQISNLNAGTGATNVTPGDVELKFNFRFSTESSSDSLQKKVEQLLKKYNLKYEIEWSLSGEPFITGSGDLIAASKDAISKVTGLDAKLSTSGGTSDGRFIAPYGVEVLELGPVNKTIHKVNENVSVADLNQLSEIYEQMLVNLLL